MKKILYIISLVFFFTSCATYKLKYSKDAKDWQKEKPSPTLELEHRMYLIGDAGKAPKGKSLPVLKHAQKLMDQESENSSVIFLGDNIYPVGMPKKDAKGRALAEHRLDVQLEILDDFKGTPIFIPGNHDWYSGLSGLKRQEKYIEKYLQKVRNEEDGNFFLPDDGCSGPEVVELTKNIVVMIVDTQWWLEDWDKSPKINDGCPILSRDDFLFQFENTVRKYRNKTLIIAMHHPLYSNGTHGGNFSAKAHLFPLTELNKKLYVPLPGLGSFYVFLRRNVGITQDIPHPLYQQLKDASIDAATKNGNFIFVHGHDHNLQYFENDKQNYILSGSGSKSSPVKLGKGAKFVTGDYGYAVVDFYTNGEAWLKYLVPNKEGTDATEVYRRQVHKKSDDPDYKDADFPEYFEKKDSITRKTTLTKVKESSNFRKKIMGEHYADIYKQDYTFPVLDLETFKGGVKPLKRGGGFQTTSLRLGDETGKQYVMRDMTKDASRVLGFPFNKMKMVTGIVEESFLSSHPFAPLALPTMADAVNIYHTNPTLYYVPKQPRLGGHNEVYGGSVYLVEERPSKDWTGSETFGGADKIISTPDVVEKITKNNKHKIDQPWALRSRLFDILIGDWDRHDDQWRWARFKQPDDKRLYRPVPRDRDQVFSKYDGLFTGIIRFTSPFTKQLANYDGDIRNIKWHVYNGNNFDNSFLNELDWSDWEKEVKFLQANLTDEIIEEGFSKIPAKANAVSAAHIKKSLKERRANLMNIAREFYNFLYKHTDIFGTDKRELFLVERLDDCKVKVTGYELSKKKGKRKDKIYERTFDCAVTKSISIYGLGGKDEFKVTGKVGKSILVRLIGGLNNDKFVDESSARGVKTKIYDDLRKNEVETGTEAKDLRSKRRLNNLYDRRGISHEPTFTLPIPIVGYNPDDGLILGAGATWTTYGFKKTPYASMQTLKGAYAFDTEGIKFEYKGDFINTFKEWDFYLDAEYRTPQYSFNFFGLGNNSLADFDQNDIDYYRVRQSKIRVHPAFKKRFGADLGSFIVGPLYEKTQIENTDSRFISEGNHGLTSSIFDSKNYGGASMTFAYESLDNWVTPSRGMDFKVSLDYLTEFEAGNSFGALRSYLTFYTALDDKQNIVLATKLGFNHNFGDNYDFFQSATLGGNNSLRGYRNERFYGKTAYWQNIDLRAKLFTNYNKSLPFSFGLFGGFDYGKVLDDTNINDDWHYNYGGGFWVAPVDLLTISCGFFQPIETTEEGLRVIVKLGMGF